MFTLTFVLTIKSTVRSFYRAHETDRPVDRELPDRGSENGRRKTEGTSERDSEALRSEQEVRRREGPTGPAHLRTGTYMYVFV